MTHYTVGNNTRIVILTREKHYQLDHIVSISVDHELDQIHTAGTTRNYNILRNVNVTIKQMVINDDSCLINLMRTEPIFYNIFRDYSTGFGDGSGDYIEATVLLQDEDLQFIEDDIGHVLQIDLRDNPAIYNTSFYDPSGLEEGVEVPFQPISSDDIQLSDIYTVGISIDTDALVDIDYSQPGNSTPKWLDKQLDLPYPFELYEFDYDFCAWCGMVKDKSSKHVDCALDAATEMFLRDLKDNIHELKSVVRKSIGVNIYMPMFLNVFNDKEIEEMAKMFGMEVNTLIKDVRRKENVIYEK